MNSNVSIPQGPEWILILLVGVVAVVSLGLWIWSLVHCIRNRRLSDQNRLISILLIVLLGLIGSLIYLFIPRENDAQR